MFPLHDRTRRLIGLAGFFGLCIVPTVVVLSSGVARHLPGYVEAEAERLGWQLGQKVSLQKVRHPRPGVLVYEGLELSDPETGRLVLRCRTLQAGRKTSTDEQGRRRSSLVLTASQPEVEAGELSQVWGLLERVLACRAGCPELDVQLTAGQLTVRSAESPQTLTGLRAGIRTLATGTQADVAFRFAEFPTPEPVQIRVARSRQTEPPTPGWALYTGGGELPCSLLAAALPEFGRLGPRSRFCGYLWVNQTPQGPSGELAGQFTGADLETLLADRLPQTLRGTAQLTIRGARFHAGRLEAAAGSIAAGPGVISGRLLDAAAGRLAMAPRPVSDLSSQLVSYDRLAVSFLIDSGGLQLRGECRPDGSGAILVGRYGPLLSEPVSQPIPVAALLPTLAPTGAVQVPVTRQTEWLMRRLPLPEVLVPNVADASSAPGRTPSGQGTVQK